VDYLYSIIWISYIIRINKYSYWKRNRFSNRWEKWTC